MKPRYPELHLLRLLRFASFSIKFNHSFSNASLPRSITGRLTIVYFTFTIAARLTVLLFLPSLIHPKPHDSPSELAFFYIQDNKLELGMNG